MIARFILIVPAIIGLMLMALAPARAASADFFNADGEAVGTATLTETPHGLLIEVHLRRMPPGPHAFHIHETGACSPDFGAAGGHFNPYRRSHGIGNVGGKHEGDLPNVWVAADDTAGFELLLDDVTLRHGSAALFDRDGSAFIIHAGADDHLKGPVDGPERIACAVIEDR
jgi:Cu-Zn family superoxide dismutase